MIVMKDATGMTRGYEVRHMILRHFAALAVCFILQMMFFMDLFGYGVIRTITCMVFVGMYFTMIYVASLTYAKKDGKPYTRTCQDAKWSLVYGGIMCGINILSLILFKINWTVFSDGAVMSNMYAVVYNVVFYFLQAPYLSILYTQVSGNVPLAAVALMIVIPLSASFLGYIAGMKNFSLSEALRNGMFEKNGKK